MGWGGIDEQSSVLPSTLIPGLCIGVTGDIDHCYSRHKMNGTEKEMQHQDREKQVRLLAYLFLIQAEFILVIQVKDVLKCIIMTMPFGNSTRISSVSFFKEPEGFVHTVSLILRASPKLDGKA